MITELGLDQIADLVVLERKQGIRKRLHVVGSRRPVEIAAVLGRAWIVRVLLGERRKIRRLGTHLRKNILGLGLGFFLVRRTRILGHGDQNVAGAGAARAH